MRSYSKIRERKYAGRNAGGKTSGLRTILVRARPGKPTQGMLQAGFEIYPCALGRGGIRAVKREGDGGTPLGRMRMVSGYYRQGRLASTRSALDLSRIAAFDGWCDAPADPNYNRPVRLPYKASHETMRRPDRLYDCCIVLDYNLSSRRRAAGSAIFFHIAHPDFRPTEGCVAVSPRTMARLLPLLSRRTTLIVKK